MTTCFNVFPSLQANCTAGVLTVGDSPASITLWLLACIMGAAWKGGGGSIYALCIWPPDVVAGAVAGGVDVDGLRRIPSVPTSAETFSIGVGAVLNTLSLC